MLKRDVVDHDKEVNYSKADWLYLLISLAFQAALIIFVPEWAWVGLPFWTTFLVKALKQL